MAKIKKAETFEGCILLFRIFENKAPFAQVVKRRVYKRKGKDGDEFYINFKGIKLIVNLNLMEHSAGVSVGVDVKKWKQEQIKAAQEKRRK